MVLGVPAVLRFPEENVVQQKRVRTVLELPRDATELDERVVRGVRPYLVHYVWEHVGVNYNDLVWRSWGVELKLRVWLSLGRGRGVRRSLSVGGECVLRHRGGNDRRRHTFGCEDAMVLGGTALKLTRERVEHIAVQRNGG